MIYTTRIDIKGERLQDVLVPDEFDSLIKKIKKPLRIALMQNYVEAKRFIRISNYNESEIKIKFPEIHKSLICSFIIPHKYLLDNLKAKKIKFELV